MKRLTIALFVYPEMGRYYMTNLTNIDTHAKFKTVAEMDAAANSHIYANWNDLNETDRKVLDTIRRYSSIYRAAKIKVATIAELIGKSEITVRRATAKLERLGIIERIKTKRPINVGQGANIYVILPYDDKAEMKAPEEVAKPTESKSEHRYSESDPLSFNFKPKPKPLLHNTFQFEPSLYNRFKSILSNSTGDTSIASRLFGIYRAHSIRYMRFDIHAGQGELFEDLAMQALHITTQATKRKKLRNLTGYYDGVLRKLIDKALFSDAFMDYDVEPDFRICTH